jgi:lipoprotein-releasing system ATP-binding protein
MSNEENLERNPAFGIGKGYEAPILEPLEEKISKDLDDKEAEVEADSKQAEIAQETQSAESTKVKDDIKVEENDVVQGLSDEQKTSTKFNLPTLELRGIRKSYSQGKTSLDVLNGADLVVRPGEIVALVGPSGSGKSTLLQIAGLLDNPTEGEVIVSGCSCEKMRDLARTKIRRDEIGFVYQYHHLLPEFTALENVIMPQLIAGDKSKKSKARAEWLLGKMGLKSRMTHKPSELSGGEQQRVAVARALANTPRLLLADEPTGNLDPSSSQSVFEELLRLVRETGLSALIATHNPEIAARMDRKVALRDGKVLELGSHAFIGKRLYR